MAKKSKKLATPKKVKALKKAAPKKPAKKAAAAVPKDMLLIEDAAKQAKLAPGYLRLIFRKTKVKKQGKAYHWPTREAMLADLTKAGVGAAA